MTGPELATLLIRVADALESMQRGFDPVRHQEAIGAIYRFRESPPLTRQRELSLDELLAALAYAQGVLILVREAAGRNYFGAAAQCCRWVARRRLILAWIARGW